MADAKTSCIKFNNSVLAATLCGVMLDGKVYLIPWYPVLRKYPVIMVFNVTLYGNYLIGHLVKTTSIKRKILNSADEKFYTLIHPTWL